MPASPTQLLESSRAWVLFALTGIILSIPSIYNGYPLFWYDSEMYVHLMPSIIRPPFYSLLLYPMHLTWSLWLVAFWQAVIVSHLLHLILRTTFASPGRMRHLWIIVLLTLFTSLPWVTGFVMPDLFAAILILATHLLGFCAGDLKPGERLYLHGLVTVSICVHSAHVPLAAGLVVFIGLVRFFSGRHEQHRVTGFLRMSIPLGLAVVLIAANNVVVHRRLTLSPAGYAWVLARFIEDGPATEYLKESAPGREFALCDHVGEFPMDSDKFLWDMTSPFRRVGGFQGYGSEGTQIVVGTLLRYPFWTLRTMAGNTVDQLVELEIGTTYAPLADFEMLASRVRTYFPHEYEYFVGSRQNRGALALGAIDRIHFVALLICLPVIGFAAYQFLRKRLRVPLLLLFTIVVGMVMNAFITGALSVVHARYQSRVIWLLPFFGVAAGMTLLRERRLRRAGPKR